MGKRSRERLSARDWLASEFEAGTAINVIDEFDIRPEMKVYLALRKSGCERRQNLIDGEMNLRQIVKRHGVKIVGCYRHVGSGFDTHWIIGVVAEAKQLGAHVILAETTDRFVRNIHYHSKNCPDVQATDEQLAELASHANGMRLMTHLHPDATPGEVRAYHTKRGQRLKGNRGGRPRQRYRTRLTKLPTSTRMAIRQLGANGVNVRAIAAETKVSKSVVQRYLAMLPPKWLSKLRST